jgi:hypothetical protein
MTEQVKTCSKCGETKALGFFCKNKECNDGFRPRCKECMNSYGREFRKKNPDKCREYYRKNREKNREKIRVTSKKYYEKNKDKINEYGKERREKNPEKIREIRKVYIENLPEKYVIKQITQGTGLSASSIPQELIELKRVQIQITRELRKQR